jgi:putative spermidine/putrescine transport system permease protein
MVREGAAPLERSAPFGRRRRFALAPYLQIAPLAATLLVFLVVPILAVVVVSFWDYDTARLIPAFILTNYHDLLVDPITWQTYLQTVSFALLTWALTLVIGFIVAYFLAFHVGSKAWQTVLFLVCTIPFWTSNIIRMIAWIPFLGRNGILNQLLLRLGLIHQPFEFLLFSDFAVVLAYVHLYTFFMVVPIFNSMMRIDRTLIEAARDLGASGRQTLWHLVIPLCKPGIAIGTVFILTIVMGDFVTVNVMSGGQRASVALMMVNAMSLLQYPAAAANAVLLLAIVLGTVGALMRIIDIRKEL